MNLNRAAPVMKTQLKIKSPSGMVFTVDECLGVGSSAKVYAANMLGHPDRPLVIKFIKKSYLESYLKEIEVLEGFKK
jgi:hypothetical protein